MRVRRVIFFVGVCLLSAIGSRAEPLTLPEVFAAVRERHPALAAARAEAERARSRIEQERAWMDPRASLEIKREGTLRPNTYSEVELAVSQELPLSRRNELRARTAAAEASVADASVLLRERTVLNQARSAFLRIAAIDAQRQVNARLRDNLRQTLNLAQAGYASGSQMQAELIETQSELTRLETEDNDLARLRVEEVPRLNALMQRTPEITIDILSLPTPQPVSLTGAEVVKRVRENHPELLAAARRITAAQAQLAVAKRNRTPDPEVMIRAKQMNRSGDVISAYDTGVSVSLPWFNERRNRSEVRGAESGVAAAQAEALSAEAELAGLASGAFSRAQLSFAQYTRYRDEVLPLARLRAESQQRGYVNGGIPLVAAIGAERSAIEAEMALVKSQAEYALSLAELDYLTGTDLTPL